MADVGVNTSAEIVEKLRDAVFKRISVRQRMSRRR